jgi:hypothetical protein
MRVWERDKGWGGGSTYPSRGDGGFTRVTVEKSLIAARLHYSNLIHIPLECCHRPVPQDTCTLTYSYSSTEYAIMIKRSSHL